MRTRPLGKTGLEVSVIGFGAMSLSLNASLPEADAVEILKGVLNAGVTFIDTADTYCVKPETLHHNERLVARVLQETCSPALIATKGGTVRVEKGWELNGSPEHIYRGICESYVALGGTNPIPLWQHHWPDPRYSVSDVMRVVARAVDERLIRFVGVANYTIEQIREARDTANIVSVQNQYNMWRREAEEHGVLAYCQEEDIVFLPWRPMGGLGLAHRLGEVKELFRIAEEYATSPQRVMIAWLLAKSSAILPIPGSSNPGHIKDFLAAENLVLEPCHLEALDAIPNRELPQRERPAAWRTMPPLANP